VLLDIAKSAYHHWSTSCRKVLTAEDGGTSVADNRIDSSTSSTTPVKAMGV